MKLKFIYFLFLTFISHSTFAQHEDVEQLLNNWHAAAANAEFENYFASFAEDAYFIGTDASERWSVIEFKRFAKPHFNTAPAWKFIPIQRNIEFSANRKLAWFDEVLNSDHLGVCRGSGVLIYEEQSWKIKHYVLSLIVPNALAKEVAQLKQKADQNSINELIAH